MLRVNGTSRTNAALCLFTLHSPNSALTRHFLPAQDKSTPRHYDPIVGFHAHTKNATMKKEP
jgi:hypothetical protein